MKRVVTRTRGMFVTYTCANGHKSVALLSNVPYHLCPHCPKSAHGLGPEALGPLDIDKHPITKVLGGGL